MLFVPGMNYGTLPAHPSPPAPYLPCPTLPLPCAPPAPQYYVVESWFALLAEAMMKTSQVISVAGVGRPCWVTKWHARRGRRPGPEVRSGVAHTHKHTRTTPVYSQQHPNFNMHGTHLHVA
jgi:hypothetical protein